MLLVAAMSGCATRGALQFECEGFDRYVHDLEPSRLVRDIQSDAVTDIDILARPQTFGTARDPMGSAIAGLMDIRARKAADTPRAVLLLSGGGQWGAFGAGFLGHLHDQAAQGGELYPQFEIVTGVSTGGLQAIFVAIGDAEAYEQLRTHYAPTSEEEVVDRNPTWQAVATGSVAGLAPLRRKIEGALCTRGDPALGCPVIDRLAASGTKVYIGFVEARSGKFVYADVKAIVGDAAPGPRGLERRRNAQQCLTGVAMASAAMPVFFQQVKIGPRAYYDGGVRQSVFEVHVAALMEGASRTARAAALENPATPPSLPVASRSHDFTEPPLYVVRNGPTVLGEEEKPDAAADALTAAFRAEAIVVNELEVGSIAALRLARPNGPIWLATADGFGDPPAQCTKAKGGVMFDPPFMACLQRFGVAKASRPMPWKSLSEISVQSK
ncbi:MAG: patatin-like phospholipase family protein [Sphingopyxis solisilvae]|uniref:patatin-like phospholipase family protein n=1 Tax=Sphingopyxis solisilvae TaxID=1886788 RepID=UPI0040366CF8